MTPLIPDADAQRQAMSATSQKGVVGEKTEGDAS
jgi:hypothetical protein